MYHVTRHTEAWNNVYRQETRHVAAANTHAPPPDTLWWMSGLWLAQYKTWREGPWSWDSEVCIIRDKGITKLCSTVIWNWGPVLELSLGNGRTLDSTSVLTPHYWGTAGLHALWISVPKCLCSSNTNEHISKSQATKPSVKES